MTQMILDIVSENIQRPHVAEQMPESAMKEHEREKRKNLLGGRKIRSDLGNGVTGGDKPVNVNKAI